MKNGICIIDVKTGAVLEYFNDTMYWADGKAKVTKFAKKFGLTVVRAESSKYNADTLVYVDYDYSTLPTEELWKMWYNARVASDIADLLEAELCKRGCCVPAVD